MAKKKLKTKPDLAQNAHRIMLEATRQAPKTPDPDAGKDPKAVALGRKGGLKGGKARAAKMTKRERAESARKAAQMRWERTREGQSTSS